MSKEFLSLTANLPAHADGVSGFLSDALGWVKSTYKDVTSVISKGPKGVVEAIYNELGLDDLENDFPPVVTRMAKGSAQTAQDNFVKFLQSFFKKLNQMQEVHKARHLVPVFNVGLDKLNRRLQLTA